MENPRILAIVWVATCFLGQGLAEFGVLSAMY